MGVVHNNYTPHRRRRRRSASRLRRAARGARNSRRSGFSSAQTSSKARSYSIYLHRSPAIFDKTMPGRTVADTARGHDAAKPSTAGRPLSCFSNRMPVGRSSSSTSSTRRGGASGDDEGDRERDRDRDRPRTKRGAGGSGRANAAGVTRRLCDSTPASVRRRNWPLCSATLPLRPASVARSSPSDGGGGRSASCCSRRTAQRSRASSRPVGWACGGAGAGVWKRLGFGRLLVIANSAGDCRRLQAAL